MMRWFMMMLLFLTTCGCGATTHEVLRNIVLPEERTVAYRDTSELPSVPIPANVPPRTVLDPRLETPEWTLSLDEAIRIALERCRVVRVLAGITAVASGQTIYDAAITQTSIDQALARFDAVLTQNNTWSRTNTPTGSNDLTDFTRSVITNTPVESYQSNLGLTKTNVFGGQLGLNYIENPIRFPDTGGSANPLFPGLGFPLNPQTTRNLSLSYTQPLLQGGGYRVNMAPVVIARLNTEVSFFQYKDSVQEMVRGVIEAYWSLVQARTDVAARTKQVEQSKEAFDRAKARLKVGLGDSGDVAQAEVAYTQFKATKIAAESAALIREGALRNILGLPPTDDRRIVPVSAPATTRLPFDWPSLLRLAEQRRPDIIELKIIIEAEQQRLLQSEDQTRPQLNAVAQYRWNGLNGTMPNGEFLTTQAGKYTDWTLGINFSVPLGLRQGRALVRQEKLLIEKDRANLDQALHAAIHELTATVRDLDSAYAQYTVYKETRAAAEVNLDLQMKKRDTGKNIYLDVLQAINDLGNAINLEAGALLNYNISLATLERRTGTILESHGLVFHEERFHAAGPLLHRRLYLSAIVPSGSPERYPDSGTPSESSFNPGGASPEKLDLRPKFLPPIAPERRDADREIKSR
jgi:outer membrane protein TolC